jgi:hypothetical protein
MLPTRRPIQSLNPVWEWVDVPAKTFEESAEEFLIKKIPSPATGKPIMTGLIKREQIPLYKIICALPKLTKSTAPIWADKAIMPYVCSKFPDFAKIPEFSGSLKRSGVNTRGEQRREIRRDILRSLKSMARP